MSQGADGTMGLVPGAENESSFTLAESAISAVLQTREEARRSKDFTTADRIREELKAKVCACCSFVRSPLTVLVSFRRPL